MDVYAHRGSTVLAPENTEQAFELALGYGADVLEIDVRLSRDGQVVVTHDSRVERTCNGQGAVADQTLSELKRLDAAYNFTDLQGKHYRDQGVRLITLDELFERFPTSRINVDIKDNSARAAQAVADSIKQANSYARVNVGSFHAAALGHFRDRAPEVTTAATQSEVAKLYFLGRGKKHTLPFQFLQIPVSYFGIPLATHSFIQAARSRGINVVYWTINTTEAMQLLLARGAHGIVTDRVDLACTLLGKTPTESD
ncbi:putative glycerophosphoryl diester phosphodiesterase 1 [Granulosicoccus antarcticus IMCC3135]|uniref:Putative glycerophosphoryl diester phosphodiesterase 1 n=1 Tax=Granulosicoccus antarcticus IMCC3135 TaxID=1192854 RepID=A0A2Z2NQZ8_9GAMM|nr:putative glycerophosphoryl diester phosphodiesterase 1 [Granulosicoccus antarcticus IMCC3135]